MYHVLPHFLLLFHVVQPLHSTQSCCIISSFVLSALPRSQTPLCRVCFTPCKKKEHILQVKELCSVGARNEAIYMYLQLSISIQVMYLYFFFESIAKSQVFIYTSYNSFLIICTCDAPFVYELIFSLSPALISYDIVYVLVHTSLLK